MRRTLLYFLLVLTIAVGSAQNAADVDLVVGTGFVGFSSVQKIVLQADGKSIVAGVLENSTGESSVMQIARVNVDGSIDSTFHCPLLVMGGLLNDLAVLPNGKILVAGYFGYIVNEALPKLIRLNTDGTLDTSFVYNNGLVSSIAVQPDGKIVVAGNLWYYVNEHLQRYIVRLNADGTLDPSFDFGFEGFDFIGSSVHKVVVQPDGKIIASGPFSVFNGELQGGLIRFNADGTKDLSFTIGTGITGNTYVVDIGLQSDGKILIAGAFTTWSGQPFGRLCRLNINGSLDTSFLLGVGGYSVFEVEVLSNGSILAAGNIIVNGVTRRLVRLNSSGSVDETFVESGANGGVAYVAVQANGKIMIGGSMTEVAGIGKNYFARLNANGTHDTAYNSTTGLNGKVGTVALQPDGKTLLGGTFTTFNGMSQSKMIRLASDGTKDASFNIGSGFDDYVRIIVVQPDGKLLVGGQFSSFNSAVAHSLIRLNANGSVDPTFAIGTGFNDYVQTIVLQPDGKIVVGGNFTLFNGQVQKYCVRLNSNGTKDTGFLTDSTFNNRITKLALQSDGKILVGGDFTTYAGQNQNCLIRLNIDGTKDGTFEIGSGFTGAPTDVIRAIKILENGKMYIVSITPNFNGVNVGKIIRLNANGSLDTSFTQGAKVYDTGNIDALGIQADGKLVVGGSWRSVNNLTNTPKRIMRLNSDGTLDASFKESSVLPGKASGLGEGSCLDISIQNDGKIWLVGSFYNYVGTVSFSAIRLVGDSFLSVDQPTVVANKTLLYPNPVRDVLHLNAAVSSIEIVDLSGKLMGLVYGTDEVDFSSYANGVYVVRVEKENGLFETHKIVKE